MLGLSSELAEYLTKGQQRVNGMRIRINSNQYIMNIILFS